MNNSFFIKFIKPQSKMLPLVLFVVFSTTTVLLLNVIGTAGILFMLFLITLSLLPIFIGYRNSKYWYKIDDIGLALSDGNKVINIEWNDIKSVGFQGVSSKTFGIEEAVPYLVFNVSNFNKISTVNNWGRFIFKKENIINQGNEQNTFDLYLNATEASNEKLLSFLSNKKSFKSNIAQLNILKIK